MKQPPRLPAHFDSENNCRTFCRNGSHCQQELLFRTTLTRTVMLHLLMKWLLDQTFHCFKLFIIANSEGFKVKAKRKRNAKDFAQVSHYTLSVSRFWNQELFVVYTSLKKNHCGTENYYSVTAKAIQRRMIHNCFTQKMSMKFFFFSDRLRFSLSIYA